MNNLFNPSSNVMATPLGQLVDKSTDPLIPESNIELFYEICDLINQKEENAKDAIKAIRKKISIYSGKNWSVVLNVLKLLETCSNNCNKKFQLQLANKEFLHELKSIIGPKLQPPLVIQEKVLFLIQHWTNIFKNDPDLKAIEAFYTELRTKGIDFPVYNPDVLNELDNASVLKPDAVKKDPSKQNSSTLAKPSKPANINTSERVVNPNSNFQRLNEHQIAGTAIKLNEDQMVKLSSELNTVDSNVQVLNEILSEVQSALASGKISKQKLNQNDKDIALLKELYKTCKEMQKRITQLIGNISNETIINELLRANDELNNTFLRYERFEKSIQNQNTESKTQENFGAKDEKPLIDFNDETGLSSSQTKKKAENNSNLDSYLSNMKLSENKKKDSRDDDFLDDENEIKEMENWFKTQEGLDFEKQLSSNKTEPK